jgi:hypothetical protein
MTLTAATQKQCLTKRNYYFKSAKSNLDHSQAQKNIHDYTADCDGGISCTVIAGPRKYGALGTRKHTKHTTGKVTVGSHCPQTQNAYVYAQITWIFKVEDLSR